MWRGVWFGSVPPRSSSGGPRLPEDRSCLLAVAVSRWLDLDLAAWNAVSAQIQPSAMWGPIACIVPAVLVPWMLLHLHVCSLSVLESGDRGWHWLGLPACPIHFPPFRRFRCLALNWSTVEACGCLYILLLDCFSSVCSETMTVMCVYVAFKLGMAFIKLQLRK